MSGRDKNGKRAGISECAADWYVRLRDNDLNRVDQQRYMQWLKQSPSHVAEMLRMKRLHGVLNRALSDHQRMKH